MRSHIDLEWPMRVSASYVVRLSARALFLEAGESIYPNGNSGSARELEFVNMSRIWDRLQDIERHQNASSLGEGVQNSFVPVPDRRSSERFWAYEPILVYGHAAADSPFHEGTEALHVNARGGLITLSTAVNPGQTLLLINKVNLKEQKCSVVREKSTYLNRTAIIVEFLQPVPDFWEAAGY